MGGVGEEGGGGWGGGAETKNGGGQRVSNVPSFSFFFFT